jgi:GNS1/SUR4 family
MCGPTDLIAPKLEKMTTSTKAEMVEDKRPVDVVLEPPSLVSRYVCASLMVAIFAIWGKICFMDDENEAPGIGSDIHGWQTPLVLTTSYLVLLPLLRAFSKNVLSQVVDVKLLLKETMIVYNGGQVLLNAWMVYRFVDAVMNKGHPFIGDLYTNKSGTTFAVWIHYMDKYLEFFDTFFMVLRGRMDQVRLIFLLEKVENVSVTAMSFFESQVSHPNNVSHQHSLTSMLLQ